MDRFDFLKTTTGGTARVLPLTERALFEIERARRAHEAANFQWYPCELAELAELTARGFRFC